MYTMTRMHLGHSRWFDIASVETSADVRELSPKVDSAKLDSAKQVSIFPARIGRCRQVFFIYNRPHSYSARHRPTRQLLG